MSRRRREYSPEPFVRLPKRLLLGNDAPAWWSLPAGARDLYCILKAAYNGSNNGSIVLLYAQVLRLKISGLRSSKAVCAAFVALESAGWIERTEIGGIHRHKNLYRLTGKIDGLI